MELHPRSLWRPIAAVNWDSNILALNRIHAGGKNFLSCLQRFPRFQIFQIPVEDRDYVSSHAGN